jgi:hypothetical protein
MDDEKGETWEYEKERDPPEDADVDEISSRRSATLT